MKYKILIFGNHVYIYCKNIMLDFFFFFFLGGGGCSAPCPLLHMPTCMQFMHAQMVIMIRQNKIQIYEHVRKTTFEV